MKKLHYFPRSVFKLNVEAVLEVGGREEERREALGALATGNAVERVRGREGECAGAQHQKSSHGPGKMQVRSERHDGVMLRLFPNTRGPGAHLIAIVSLDDFVPSRTSIEVGLRIQGFSQARKAHDERPTCFYLHLPALIIIEAGP